MTLAEIRNLLRAEAGRLLADAERLKVRGFLLLAADLRTIAQRLATLAATLPKSGRSS